MLQTTEKRETFLLKLLLAALLATSFATASASEATAHPFYKPSSRSPQPIDILSNSYGRSRSAPDALAIGDQAPDFVLPRAGGGQVRLADHLEQGTLVLIFYRGHW